MESMGSKFIDLFGKIYIIIKPNDVHMPEEGDLMIHQTLECSADWFLKAIHLFKDCSSANVGDGKPNADQDNSARNVKMFKTTSTQTSCHNCATCGTQTDSNGLEKQTKTDKKVSVTATMHTEVVGLSARADRLPSVQTQRPTPGLPENRLEKSKDRLANAASPLKHDKPVKSRVPGRPFVPSWKSYLQHLKSYADCFDSFLKKCDSVDVGPEKVGGEFLRHIQQLINQCEVKLAIPGAPHSSDLSEVFNSWVSEQINLAEKRSSSPSGCRSQNSHEKVANAAFSNSKRKSVKKVNPLMNLQSISRTRSRHPVALEPRHPFPIRPIRPMHPGQMQGVPQMRNRPWDPNRGRTPPSHHLVKRYRMSYD